MRRLGITGLLVTVSVLATACSSRPDTGSRQGPSGPSASSAPLGSDPPSSSAARTTAPPSTTGRQIEIVAGGVSLAATLNDTAASGDLWAQLPVSITMTDHGGVEKTGALPRALSTEGVPAGADPEPGDLGYYAPGGNLVLYYGDQSYFNGIIVLGTLDGDLAALGRERGELTVRVQRAGDG